MMSPKCLFMICCMFLCTQAGANLEKYGVAKGGQEFFFKGGSVTSEIIT